jgi:hypothetical protein
MAESQCAVRQGDFNFCNLRYNNKPGSGAAFGAEQGARRRSIWTRHETYPAIARQAKADGGEVFFWDESGFRADAVHGRTWGVKGTTPVERPGQRQSISAASAVNAKGAFWYCPYEGGLTAELFVQLLCRMMRHRSKPVHLVVDGLPAHKTKLVKRYVESTKGRLTLHFLPGYAPELNPG